MNVQKTLFLLVFVCLSVFVAQAQVTDRAKNRAKYKTNQKVDQTVDKTIDKGFKALGGLFKKKKKKEEPAEETEEVNEEQPNNNSGESSGISNGTEVAGNYSEEEKEAIQLWSVRYDFKPGKDIIFFDDFEDEEVGEIPSQWFYEKGVIEVVQVGEDNQAMAGDLYTHPNWPEGFTLPERFTIEFDIYLFGGEVRGSYHYGLFFKQDTYREAVATVYSGFGSVSLHNVAGGPIPGSKKEDFVDGWHHISLSVNGTSIKGYFDDYRTFNARFPDGKKPNLFTLWNCCFKAETPQMFLIDNFKVAAGAHPKYKEQLVDGKIVTHNILFDYDSDKLIPRSFAEINRIAQLMQKDESLNFRVEGHTDSDGDDAYNLKLSESRAKAVKEALVTLGVAEDRLEYKGMGETQPMEANDTPENKAKNRRVEFVKI